MWKIKDTQTGEVVARGADRRKLERKARLLDGKGVRRVVVLDLDLPGGVRAMRRERMNEAKALAARLGIAVDTRCPAQDACTLEADGRRRSFPTWGGALQALRKVAAGTADEQVD